MRSMFHFVLAATSLIAGAASHLRAQPINALAVGAQARLITPRLDASQQLVRIISTTPDSVTFRSEANPVARTIAVSDLIAIEVRTPVGRPFLRNILIGAGLGAAVGAAISATTYEECTDCFYAGPSRGDATEEGAISGGLGGVVLGAAVAMLQKKERWTRIPLHPQVRVGSTPWGGPPDQVDRRVYVTLRIWSPQGAP